MGWSRVRCPMLPALIAGFAAIQSAAAEEPAQGPYQDVRLVTVLVDSPRTFLAVAQLGEMLACQPGPGPIDFAMPADAIEALNGLGVPFIIRSENLQSLVDEQARLNDEARAERGADFFAAYRTIGEIWSHLDTLAALDEGPLPPGHIVDKFDVGSSIQGRPIYGLKITTPTQMGAPTKPVFLITATQHAREWVAASTAMWICDRLARQYGIDPVVTSLLNNVDFRIIPVVNPDGYNHSFPTAQGGGGVRLWRKNRRLNSGGSYGVDLNRNWGVGWGLSSGSSGTQSSDTYRGTAAFSEPETSQIRDFVLTLPNIKAHIDLHSYSQLVLGPWGYQTTTPPRSSELNPLTNAMISAISATNGAVYTGGPASTTLYLASGVAPDWTFGAMAALSWTYELRDTGQNGFTLPPSQILPTATEAFQGIRTLAEHIQIRLRITVSSPPTLLALQTPADFGVSITTENSYTLAPGSARLLWRAGASGPYTESPLTGGPTNFTATLPGFACGRTINYFVQATASDGLIVRSPASSDYTAATPPCPGCYGDGNADGFINFQDITTILSNWGQSGPAPLMGDANFDGVVDFADLTAALGSWNDGC